MEKLVLHVPAMYADHHVLAVRQALSRLSGVDDVEASSSLKLVRLVYDPAKIDPIKIQEALAAAGYGSKEEMLSQPPSHHDEYSAWHTLIRRITATNQLDLEMSGDFRKY